MTLKNLTFRDIQIATKKILDRKCTLCNKRDCLMRLEQHYQEYSRQKGFESYFCTNCIQVVNFVI